MLVDDDPDLRALLKRVLERDGHHVRTAPNGAIALDMCSMQLPDVIVMDLMMPHMDGELLITRLRERHAASMPPVALLTASAIRDEIAERMQVEVVLSKPFQLDEVREAVEQLLRGDRPSRP